MSTAIHRPQPGDQLRLLLYNGDLCVGASDDPTLWYAVLEWLIDDECRRFVASEPPAAGEGEG